MAELTFIYEGSEPVTVEKFLMRQSGVSRRLLTRLKRQENGITCDGTHVRTIDMVRHGSRIVLRTQDDSFLEPNPLLSVPIAFESEDVVVFDKPPGMPVHPSIKHRTDTLGNFFASRYPGLTFRAVNRLDRDTSGLCIIAKNAHAANVLQGKCEKVYTAVVEGVTPEEGTVDAPIARQQESVILRCVREDGQPSVTHFRRISGNDRYSLLRFRLETGRTHQIRVHMAHIGHPLAGDDLYGGSRADINRQALHCCQISFTDPKLGNVTAVSPLPGDIAVLL